MYISTSQSQRNSKAAIMISKQLANCGILCVICNAARRFPHVAMCDYKIRQNTNVHRYTVQCVLPINIFNEKIFTIVWFWLLVVGVITVVALLRWLCQLTYWPAQYRYVRRQLGSAVALSSAVDVAAATVGIAPVEPASQVDMRRFADMYLRRDGLFVLRLVSTNAGDLVSTELLSALWNAYSLSHRHSLPTSTKKVHSFKVIRSLLRATKKAPTVSSDASPQSDVNGTLQSPTFEEV